MSSAVDFSDGLKVITYREQGLRNEDQKRFIEKLQEQSRADQQERANTQPSDAQGANGAASAGKAPSDEGGFARLEVDSPT